MISLKMNLPLAALAALILTAGVASAAAPVCPAGDTCVTATENGGDKIVLVDVTPPFDAVSCTTRTGTPDCIITIFVPPSEPDSLVLDTQSRLIYSETQAIPPQIRRVNPDGTGDTLVAGAAQGIVNPFDMILDPTGQFLYVSNMSDGLGGGNKITITDLTMPLPNATTCPTPVISPQGLAFDTAGNLYVLAQNTPAMPGVSGIYRINKVTCAVLQSNVGFDPANSLDGLTYDPSTNRLFAASNAGNSIYSIDPATLAAVKIATVPRPDGLINDSHGTLYIAARNNGVYSVNETTFATTQLTPVPFIDDLGIVPAQAPGGLKTFNPPSVGIGGNSTLTITITNTNPAIPLTSVGFTDALPAGIVVAAVPALVNGCGGIVTGATAGSTSVTLSGVTLAGGATCAISFSVTDNNAGGTTAQNCVTVMSMNGGPGNQSCANLAVLAGPALPPTISKAFVPASVPVGGLSTLTFTILNPNPALVPYTNVSFTDTLPAGVKVATPNGLVNGCGGVATATAGGSTISLTGAPLAGGATCTVAVSVIGTVVGVQNNVSGPVTAVDPNANVLTGNTAMAALVVVGPPAIAKSFNPTSILVGGTSTLTFLINNPNATTALTGVSFSDTLPAGLLIATPNGLTGSCGGGTITAPAGTNTITLTGATLVAGGSCTFSVNVTATTLSPPGGFVNTTSAVMATGPFAFTGNTATATLAVVPPPPPPLDNTYQLRYFANLDKGDSYINLTNAGTLDGRAPAGNICVNVYTFDPAEELISCCACPITPNGLASLSVRNDLLSNTLTPGVPTSVTVKLLSSAVFDVNGFNISASSCNASGVNTGVPGPPRTGDLLTRGMRAWATTLHLNTSALPAPGVYQKTETPFSGADLSATELAKLNSYCGFIQTIGSGFGICKSCRLGALGGEIK